MKYELAEVAPTVVQLGDLPAYRVQHWGAIDYWFTNLNEAIKFSRKQWTLTRDSYKRECPGLQNARRVLARIIEWEDNNPLGE